jgi:hypothetical protein
LSAAPNPSSFPGPGSPIAGSVLPIRRAEELLATLPGVLSAKIVATDSGAVDEIHLLTTAEFAPKQTVRNVESALLAHLGLRVDHRKISVATTTEASRVAATAAVDPDLLTAVVPEVRGAAAVARRRLYFEDVEVRRSRARGITCRVTLRKAEASYIGESAGPEGVSGGENGGTDRGRVEIAARATLKAISQAERGDRVLALEGATVVSAFGRSFVFIGIAARVGRVTALLTGSCEVRENPETAGVLAVLDATNRWIAYGK